MKKTSLVVGLMLALSAGYTVRVFAQAKPDVLLEQRKAAMVLQGKYLYPLIPMAQGKISYDAGTVARNTAYLEVLTQMPWDGFDPRTAGLKNTRALPEIYKDPAAFKAAQDKLHAEMAKFSETVKSRDETRIKAGIVELNKVCNACHDKFRRRM